MSREFDFLLAAVRWFFRPDSPPPSRDGLDENRLVDLAHRHGVVRFLQLESAAAAPGQSARDSAQASLALSAELLKLIDRLGKEKIDAIPLKGPVLGSTLYQDRLLKVSTDLDLLVRRRDVLRTKRVLENMGYRLEPAHQFLPEHVSLRNVHNELSFNDPKLWLKLDLHWTLLPTYFPAPVAEEELWAKVRRSSYGNSHILTLSPEHQVIFLCAHGAKHLWARLCWLCDLARLIQVERIDWVQLFDDSRRSHTTRMVLVGLVLADHLFGVGLPPIAAALVRRDQRTNVLTASIEDRLRHDRPPTGVSTALFSLRLFERNRHRAWLILEMLLHPTEADYRMARTPPSLYWVYYGLRPIRLTVKYGGRMISRAATRSA